MKSKLIYVVIASSGTGMAKNLRSAILDAGIEIGNDPEPVEIHQLPLRSVSRVDLDSESQTVTPVWSPEMNTLAGQQIRNQLCTVNHFRVTLDEHSIGLIIDDVEVVEDEKPDDQGGADNQTPPEPKGDDVAPSNPNPVPPPKPKTTRKPRTTKKT